MPKINPWNSWQPLENRWRQETNPRIATLVKAVRDHMEYEIKGEIDALMGTLTAEPIYHFWGGPQNMVLQGRAMVEGFYKGMIAAGGNQFEVVVDKIIADTANVVTEGQVKQVRTGKELKAQGVNEINGIAIGDKDLYLTTAQLVTVWPGDAEGKLVGEDIYFGEDAMKRVEKITAADLPSYYRWEFRT